MLKPTNSGQESPRSGGDSTTVWECKCARCGFSWTDNQDNTTCPECGADEGICVKTEIPSNPIMPSD